MTEGVDHSKRCDWCGVYGRWVPRCKKCGGPNEPSDEHLRSPTYLTVSERGKETVLPLEGTIIKR